MSIKRMLIKGGIAVSPGYRIRRALVLSEEEEYIVFRRFLSPNETPEEEILRFQAAVEAATEEIEAFKQEAREYLSEESLQIFSVHQMILKDPKIYESVVRKIRNHRCRAEYAVSRTMKALVRRVKSLPNEFFANRAQDFVDIERRLIRHLAGEQPKTWKKLQGLSEEVIVVAKDLTPSQTASFDRRFVVGLATDYGGKTSHTAIVARALGIPAVVGLGDLTRYVSSEDLLVVDGIRGLVIVNPDEETLEKYRRLEHEYEEYGRRLRLELKDLPCETKDGYEIHLLANIEVPEDIEIATQNGAEGVGLFRTEFLYTRTNSPPSEEVHFEAYRRAIEDLKGKPIVIRLLDLGADKFYDRIRRHPEKNPFLGCRSIRYLFQEIPLLKEQLRAILRVSAVGDVRILLPMITSVDEVRRFKGYLEDAMSELHDKNIEFDPHIQVGVMMEVPSSILIADLLAREVDFFSIGTNDLIQYTLAVDRINEQVASLYQPSHPAVLRMIKKVIDTGRRHNIPVSICGEMSAEVRYILPLLGLGLTSLSLTPKMIPHIKKVIRSTTMQEARAISQEIFQFDEAEKTERYLATKVRAIVPDLFQKIEKNV